MSMIEGIGDEVIQFFAVVFVIILALLAWWSTNITEGPLIRTVLILERRSRSRTGVNDTSTNLQPSITVSSNENNIDTGQVEVNSRNLQDLVENESGDGLNQDITEDKEANESSSTSSSLLLPSVENVQRNNAAGDNNENQQDNAIPEQTTPVNDSSVTAATDPDSTTLRKRRLAFFQSRGPTLLETSETSNWENNSNQPRSTDEGSSNSGLPPAVNEEIEDRIRIRLKYLNDDLVVVEGKLNEQLGDFKRRHFRIELAAEKMVRLIFNGQVLQSDSQTLQGYGLFDNCVVHCLVHSQRNNMPRNAQMQSSHLSNNAAVPPDWNLGTLLYTCLSVILGFAWFCRYQYSHLFTVTTTAALFGLTGMFAVTLLSIYLPDEENIV